MLKNQTSISSTMSVLLFLLPSFSSLLASACKHDDFLRCFIIMKRRIPLIFLESYTLRKTPHVCSAIHYQKSQVQYKHYTEISSHCYPTNVSHIQATVICSRKHGLQTRILSGGHDSERLSYVSNFAFVVLDLINLQNIRVDAEKKTPWVQSGAKLGELYYRITEKSRMLAFLQRPARLLVLSGGGYGYLFRSYGLAADNVVDALLIDVRGRIPDRASTGIDLFWSICGGGGDTYVIVIAWKVNLVEVPPLVTVFTIQRTLEQDALNHINQWQYVAHKLPNEIELRVFTSRSNNTTRDRKAAIVVSFTSVEKKKHYRES